MMAASDGLTLRRLGGVGMFGGRRRTLCEIAVCTSCAAASMSRARSNCSVILVLLVVLVEFIEGTPGMALNCCSSGVATAAAMVLGSAPGSEAETLIVGKSTLGSSLTGKLT